MKPDLTSQDASFPSSSTQSLPKDVLRITLKPAEPPYVHLVLSPNCAVHGMSAQVLGGTCTCKRIEHLNLGDWPENLSEGEYT